MDFSITATYLFRVGPVSPNIMVKRYAVWSIRAVGCLVVLWFCSACAPEPDHAPSYLVGVWETRTDGYADQHMFIDQTRTGFGTSALAADGYVITKVDESREGD